MLLLKQMIKGLIDDIHPRIVVGRAESDFYISRSILAACNKDKVVIIPPLKQLRFHTLIKNRTYKHLFNFVEYKKCIRFSKT